MSSAPNTDVLAEIIGYIKASSPQPDDFTLAQYIAAWKADNPNITRWIARAQLERLINQGAITAMKFPGYGRTIYYRKVKQLSRESEEEVL